MTRPTEQAAFYFKGSERVASTVMIWLDGQDPSPKQVKETVQRLAGSIYYMAKGLAELSTAIRATYVLLEEVKAMQQRK